MNERPKIERDGILDGRVLRVDARKARVLVGDRVYDCHMKGSLFRAERRYSKPVAVGDFVLVEGVAMGAACIVEVLERRNLLARRRVGSNTEQVMAANLDQSILVQSCHDPELNLRLLDRLLVGAERAGLRSIIVLNKVDLVTDRDALAVVDEVYAPLDYTVVHASARTGEGLDRLAAALAGATSIFAGPSGVGKSALLTAIQPDLALKSAAVSDATGKGMHTTTAASLLRMANGGLVVDTPGVREFLPSALAAAELRAGFVEFARLQDRCRFADCTHDHEQDCAVKEAVAVGALHEHRYDSYLRILSAMQSGDD